jgi:hypothetical protein
MIKLRSRLVLLVVTLIIGILSCNKEPAGPPGLPMVQTLNAEIIDSTHLRLHGDVVDEIRYKIIDKGFSWSLKADTATKNRLSFVEQGPGNFSHDITVIADTTYYIRAYAKNKLGIAYGEQKEVNTNYTLPKVETLAVRVISTMTAEAGGNILADGGQAISGKGVCWSETPGPTINNFLTRDGSGNGSFTSNVSGLSPNKTWYLRAYASNSSRTGYGKEFSFTTTNAPIRITHNAELGAGYSGGVYAMTIDIDGDQSADYQFKIYINMPHGAPMSKSYSVQSIQSGYSIKTFTTSDTTFYSMKRGIKDTVPNNPRFRVRMTVNKSCRRISDTDSIYHTQKTMRLRTSESTQILDLPREWSEGEVFTGDFGGTSSSNYTSYKVDTVFFWTIININDCYNFPTEQIYMGIRRQANGDEKFGWIRFIIQGSSIYVFESELEPI